MKKIALGIMAVALTFSAMAQSADNGSQNKELKGGNHRHFNAGGNIDQLNLTDDQKAQAKSINEDFRKQMKDLQKQTNLSEDEKKQKHQALLQQHKEKIATILTPEQRKQAAAIAKDARADRTGNRSDRFESLTKDLNLTPEQSAKMATLNSNFKTNLQNIRQNSLLSNDEKKEQMKSLMKQHRSDMETLLTDEQKEQLKARQKNRSSLTAVK